MNPILHPAAPGELEGIFATSPPCSPLPPWRTERWSHALDKPWPRAFFPTLTEMARAESDAPLPPLTPELYADFHHTGRRDRFESVYFERRRRLGRAALCLLRDPDSTQWRASFLDKWRAIFDQPSWALPAHVQGASGVDPKCLDLFSAETANLMAELLCVFPDVPDEEFARRIRERVRRDFVEEYLDTEWWWQRGANNWNAVCHQGVLGAALKLETDAPLLARLTTLVATRLNAFLDGFTADGGCSEGPGYWTYGFSFFCLLNEQIERRTVGRVSLLDGDPRVERIAGFGHDMVVPDGKLVNFADTPEEAELSPWLHAYLGRRRPSPADASLAESLYQRQAGGGPAVQAWYLGLLAADFPRLAYACLEAPEQPPDSAPAPGNVFYPALEVWISRGRDEQGTDWTLAAKAGHNAEHHNHNDCGSLIFYAGGTRWLSEIGSPEYSREYFGAKRYEALAARSAGHSVPRVAGYEQPAGEEYRASVIAADFAPEEDSFCIDLTHVYPAAAGLAEYTRHLVVRRSLLVVEITDRWRFVAAAGAMVEWFFITPQIVHVEAAGFCLEDDRHQSLEISVAASCPLAVPTTERLLYANNLAQPRFVNRLRLASAAAAAQGEIVLKIHLVEHRH